MSKELKFLPSRTRLFLKDIIQSNRYLKSIYKRYLLSIGDVASNEVNCARLEEAQQVLLDKTIDCDRWFVGLVKDDESSNEYSFAGSYYLKYERFLKNNNIKYEYYDIKKENWITQAKRFNVVIWHTDSSPDAQEDAAKKIHILSCMGIKTMPSFDALFKYEDKVVMSYFYMIHDLPAIPTYVFCLKQEAVEFAKSSEYPIISKITTGSGSEGVILLKTEGQAIRLINRAFSYKGARTYWPYVNQKNYVYFQKFISDAQFDLRVIVVGDSLFGYYRFPKKNDFRASGAGNYQKKEIDSRALDIAWTVKQRYKTECLSTDFVYSAKDDKFYIIESSVFIGVDTCAQLEIDGVAGRYKRVGDGDYVFESGKYWVQELTLKEFFQNT